MSGDDRKRKQVPRMLTGHPSAERSADPSTRPLSEMGICGWTKVELVAFLERNDPEAARDYVRQNRDYVRGQVVDLVLRQMEVELELANLRQTSTARDLYHANRYIDELTAKLGAYSPAPRVGVGVQTHLRSLLGGVHSDARQIPLRVAYSDPGPSDAGGSAGGDPAIPGRALGEGLA